MIAIASEISSRHRLSELLAGLGDERCRHDVEVGGLTLDSRQVSVGDLFVALPGTGADGRDFVQDALRRGAVAVLCEAGGGYDFTGLAVPVFVTTHVRSQLGIIVNRFFGSPSQELTVIGVTGTNGKTTCTHLLAQTLDSSAERCALIGTLGSGFPDALEGMDNTTPDVVAIHRLLGQFLHAGASRVCLEVSSHALDQQRTAGVAFDIAVFTNLSRDHLDYHADMHRYAQAKAALFEVDGLRCAVVNRDDAFGRELLGCLAGRVETISFGIEGGDVHARAIRLLTDGLEVEAMTPQGAVRIRCPLLGRFNAANLLAALASLLACGVGLDAAQAGLSAIKPVAGRVERFGGKAGVPLVVVDYAHTPDALEQVLRAVREHAHGRVCCVFGCGGDRDRGKRPQMGRLAEQLSDRVVLTDDNPRHEPGDRIIADIAAGMQARPRVIRDRAEAISTAIAEADARDVVLIAGKGHEDYQQVGDRRIPYSDRATVRRLLGDAA